jgi:hypothetical protein
MMQATGIFICIALLFGCSKAERQPGEDEKHEWQRLKAVQYYWQQERNAELESFSNTLRSLSEPGL